MRTCTTFFGALLFASASAQVTFQRAYGIGAGNEIGYSVQPTADGGYIIGGFINVSSLQQSDGFLIKLDAYGDTLWTRSYGGSNYEHFLGVGQTVDGGYIAAGIANLNIGSSDFYAVRTDANGAPVWSKSYGVFGPDEAQDVLITSDGGCLMVGWTGSIGAGSTDILLVKTDANGDTLWTRAIGANTNDAAFDISETIGGGFVMVGNVYDQFVTFDTDIYVVGIAADGTTALVQSYGGPPPEQIGDAAVAIEATPDGGFIIAGRSPNWGVAVDDILIKVDNVGGMEWAKSYGGDNLDYVHEVKNVPGGGYIFCGSSSSTTGGSLLMAYAVRTDANGDTLWTRTYGYGSEQEFYSVAPTADGGFLFTGFVRVGLSPGQQNVYVVKTDANGNSGCNEFPSETTVATIAPSVATQLALPAAGLNVVNTLDQVGAGTVMTVQCLNTGMTDPGTQNNFCVYPQPSDGRVRFNSPFGTRPVNVEVADPLGAVVHAQYSPAGEASEIDLSHLRSGPYLLSISDGSARVTGKLLIHRE